MALATKRKAKTRDESVADAIISASSLALRAPPSIVAPLRDYVQKVAWKPSAIKVYTVDLGCKVSKSLVSSMVGSSVLTSALGSEIAAAATLTSAAQAQAIGLLALRIPLSVAGRIAGNGPTTARLIKLINAYASRNAHAVAQMAAMSPVAQVATLGVKGSIIGAIATAAVQESVAVAYYCHGGGTFDVLVHQTATIGMGAASTVGGGTIGAAVGCLVMPGLGTAFGSLVGGYLGSMVPFYSRGNGYAHQFNEDPRNPSRKVKTVAARVHTTRSFRGDTADLGGGWLEVVDCSTESYFRFAPEGAHAADSLALLREYSSQRLASPSLSGPSSLTSLTTSHAMCGFGAEPSVRTAAPPADSAASWSSFLNPLNYLPNRASFAAAPAAAASTAAIPATCSSFFLRAGEEPPKPADDEMIIYFSPLGGSEENAALEAFDTSFATCLSAEGHAP